MGSHPCLGASPHSPAVAPWGYPRGANPVVISAMTALGMIQWLKNGIDGAFVIEFSYLIYQECCHKLSFSADW
jgi:hypothetical protein